MGYYFLDRGYSPVEAILDLGEALPLGAHDLALAVPDQFLIILEQNQLVTRHYSWPG